LYGRLEGIDEFIEFCVRFDKRRVYPECRASILDDASLLDKRAVYITPAIKYFNRPSFRRKPLTQ
jgi:hypothetical protein